MLTKDAIVFKQGDFTFYLLALSGKQLLENTEVAFFKSGENNEELGYQRPLIKAHYAKISKYLIEPDAILPPAIITAIESENITYVSGELTIKKNLRVVDGQHRIEGIRNLEHISPYDYKKALEFEYPTIIMSLGHNDKINEINTFIYINKRGKKVSTNLAFSLAERLRSLEVSRDRTFQFKEAIESTAAKICNNLVSSEHSLWFNLISMGDEVSRTKPVSINLFISSLIPVISVFFNKGHGLEKESMVTQEEMQTYTNQLGELINSVWKKISEKWDRCFLKYKPYYNEEYNIQKGIGVYPIHMLLHECMRTSNGNITEAERLFDQMINQSQLSFKAWKSGGRFSGFNSKKGFEIIAKTIKNIQENEIEEEELY